MGKSQIKFLNFLKNYEKFKKHKILRNLITQKVWKFPQEFLLDSQKKRKFSTEKFSTRKFSTGKFSTGKFSTIPKIFHKFFYKNLKFRRFSNLPWKTCASRKHWSTLSSFHIKSESNSQSAWQLSVRFPSSTKLQQCHRRVHRKDGKIVSSRPECHASNTSQIVWWLSCIVDFYHILGNERVSCDLYRSNTDPKCENDSSSFERDSQRLHRHDKIQWCIQSRFSFPLQDVQF